jgi:hypothetical protein
MIADDEAPQRPLSEKLDREGGVFVEPDAREVSCDPDEEPCAPDEYVNDPENRSAGVPGTVDDLPLPFGVDESTAADQHLVMEGPTEPAGESREDAEAAEDQGAADEKELWAQQSQLFDEDKASGVNVRGFDEEEIPEILDAMGEDAEDVLPDSPGGTSATGDWTTPEHGGFPEHED